MIHAAFLLKILYFILPAGFANMAPVFVKSLPVLKGPIDMGLKLRGKRIFGAHKTWRGMIFGITFAIIITIIQKLLYRVPFFNAISLLDYSRNFLIVGILSGVGAIGGDCMGSFIKRRLGISEGQPLLVLDQIDWIIGSLLLLSIVVRIPLNVYGWSLLIGLFAHLIIKYMGYLLRIGCKPV